MSMSRFVSSTVYTQASETQKSFTFQVSSNIYSNWWWNFDV